MNPPGLRILNRAQVRTCVADIDPVLVVDHDVLVGRVPAIRPGDGVVVSNPFGLGVLDVGLLAAVEAGAVRRGLATVLDLEEDVSW